MFTGSENYQHAINNPKLKCVGVVSSYWTHEWHHGDDGIRYGFLPREDDTSYNVYRERERERFLVDQEINARAILREKEFKASVKKVFACSVGALVKSQCEQHGEREWIIGDFHFYRVRGIKSTWVRIVYNGWNFDYFESGRKR